MPIHIFARKPLRRNGTRALAFAKSWVVALAVLAACEPPPISQLPAESGIARIRENHADERWDLTISEVDEFRSRYPYSQYAAEAELLQADAFFQSGRYPEAIGTYDSFVSKFPRHPQAGFALFRSALSIDRQSPEQIDREQIYSQRAIDTYGRFLEKHPNDENRETAKQRIKELRRRVAEHYLFIARFYWKKDMYHSALSRYLEIISEYPMFPDLREEAIERASEAYEELATRLEKNPDSDQFRYFKDQSPESLRQQAARLRQNAQTSEAERSEEPADGAPKEGDVEDEGETETNEPSQSEPDAVSTSGSDEELLPPSAAEPEAESDSAPATDVILT